MSPTEHLAVTVPGEEETKSKLEGSMLSAPGTIPGTAEAARQAEKDGDSSGPLFSLYHEMTDEEDKMRAERWQKDADGILVFVRTSVSFFTSLHTSNQCYRRVCSLLPLLH
jgi:hypothetical protein